MASIDQQIDEAVVLMKARAVDFVPTVYGDSLSSYIQGASAKVSWAQWHDGSDLGTQDGVERELVYCMLLCALALSLLPKEET
jgi:hypothetical protein